MDTRSLKERIQDKEGKVRELIMVRHLDILPPLEIIWLFSYDQTTSSLITKIIILYNIIIKDDVNYKIYLIMIKFYLLLKLVYYRKMRFHQ